MTGVHGHVAPLLFGSDAHHPHVQNMALALHEDHRLFRFVSRGVDSFHSPMSRWLRATAGRVFPQIDLALAPRRVSLLPHELVTARWGWEVPRLLAGQLGWPGIQDLAWERGEHALDAYCARLVARADVGGFIGLQHGSLASIDACARAGKPSFLAFLSPHRQTRVKFVDAEFERYPQLGSPSDHRLRALSVKRDERVDLEARRTAWIVSGSSFTTRSIVEAGHDARKVLTIPLGGPEPVDRKLLAAGSRSFKCLYAGNLSVLKGTHHLLRAWVRADLPNAELHLYGKSLLPVPFTDALIAKARPGSVVMHGPVPPETLQRAYRSSSVLVFPTLCDGFGQVVTEAMANGLPVIATTNAGAADLIVPAQTGWVIRPGSEDDLVERLSWCASHLRELDDMRSATLTAAAKHTWPAFRQRFRTAIALALAAPDPA